MTDPHEIADDLATLSRDLAWRYGRYSDAATLHQASRTIYALNEQTAKRDAEIARLRAERDRLEGLIDEIAPQHQRTTCSDGDSHGNEYSNEFGAPRCTRCCLIHRLRHGEWPNGARPVESQIWLGQREIDALASIGQEGE